jgi:hypothetical protein
MNAEFHYYAVRYLCVRAGMDEGRADLVARSSQYVDNAIHAYRIEDEGYLTQVTQNYVFWDEDTSRSIYLPFHFLPGDPDLASRERRDGRASRWAVTADSPLARELLVRALRSGNPFRIGIALHAYADTWAHQHFSGRLEEGNTVEASATLPPAGHLQALRSPDDAALRWRDGRLLPSLSAIDNADRFLSAARKIYRYLRTSLRQGFEDEELALDGLRAIWRGGSGDMGARLADFAIYLDVPPYDKRSWLAEAGIRDETADEGRFAGYDKILWVKAELGKRTGFSSGLRHIDSGGRFKGSALHLWNEAAAEHRAVALELLSAEGLA